MTTFIGSVEPYIPGTSFADYAERLQYVFNYNNVPEASRKSLFITVGGATVFSEIKKLFPGVDVETLTYTDIINRLKSRYDKTDGLMKRIEKFYERCQGKDEMVEDFILDVKLLAEGCGFTAEKDTQIRNRIALACSDLKARERIYELENPTLAEVERILIAREQAVKQSLRVETTERGLIVQLEYKLMPIIVYLKGWRTVVSVFENERYTIGSDTT